MIDDTRAARVWIMAVVLSAIILANLSCGGSSNNPGPTPCDPALAKTNGDGQTAPVSTPLPDTLIVRATECDPVNPQGPQLPEAGVAIAWVVTSGGGTVNGAAIDTVTTDANGFARAIWVLGPTQGNQAVSATAVRSTPDVVTFSAFADPPVTGCPVGSTQHAAGARSSDETWGPGGHVVTGSISFTGSAALTIEAGAHVCLEGGGIEFTEQSHLFVRGVSGTPAIIDGGGLNSLTFGVNIFALTTASTISNARLEGATISVSGSFNPVVIESTLVRDASVFLAAPGSALRHSTIVRGRLNVTSLAGGPIEIEATVRDSPVEGVFINGSGVTLTGCEVTGSATDGILSAGDATMISIHGSNLFANGGVGLSNGDTGTLDASGNWWGDPAGPNGPSGDGVSGNVTVSGALSAPAILGFRPPE